MVCWFGDVVVGQMKLSPIGEIVEDEWLKTPIIRVKVMLDVWQVMPNHMHGIVVIWGSDMDRSSGELPFVDWENNQKPKPTLQPNSLGSILGQFKSKCTKRIHDGGYPEFRWQGRFHDHIIRDDEALERIREYIRNNPANWSLDKENSGRFR